MIKHHTGIIRIRPATTSKCGNPSNPHDAIKHNFTSIKKTPDFPKTRGLRIKISMKLVYQYNFL